MTLRPNVSFLLASALLVVATVPASAQVTISADVGLYSAYVWHGLTLTNKFVIEPEAYLTFPLGPGEVSVGGWMNIEPDDYDGEEDISLSAGKKGITEFDWWVDYTHTVPRADITVGIIGYTYPNDDGLTSDDNTEELYGIVSFDAPLSPSFSVYYDVGEIKGAYFEGAITHPLDLTPAASLELGALVGINAGQGINEDDEDESANFEDDGITHVDLSATASFPAGPFSIDPTFHFLVNVDEFTKFTKAEEQDDTKVWFGVNISWTSDSGEEDEEGEGEEEEGEEEEGEEEEGEQEDD